MGTPGNGFSPAPPARTEELRREIEQTRTELGETVEALASKADVKARVQSGVHDVVVRANETARDLPATTREWALRLGRAVREQPAPYAAAVGAFVLFVALMRWRRGR